ncbi:MAG: type II toxin-antitoxin system prevent-host-death family antitoxin [Deltaproteobacteria bacterium]|nr:type II toxin-antitoxin system prevent-host-death family antitoxin [Deltaproteobacteria bacterium]
MINIWKLEQAKTRLEQVVHDAMESGPQTIMVNGRRTAVVLSADDYDRMARSELSTAEFLKKSSLVGVDLNIKRDKSRPRSNRATGGLACR